MNPHPQTLVQQPPLPHNHARYDELGRLLTAQRGPDNNIQRKYSYDYDRFGNRWRQTVVAGSGFGGANTFNYPDNRVTCTGFSYDTSGNLTANGPGASYTFNSENFMTAAGASVSYTVDNAGRRTKKTVSGATTNYFYSGANAISELQGSTWTDYVFFGNQRIAKQTGSASATATYLHPDHLGSTRRCTDSSGNSNGSCDYEPFGEFQPGSSCSALPTNYRFAGMEFDSETGLYHTQFRQYDVNQGRWMAVDAIPGKPDTPQSQDRYVYVMNDPVNNVDPLGLLCTDVYWVHIEYDSEGVFDPYASYSVLIGQVCRTLGFEGPQRLGGRGGGGGGDKPSSPKPPKLPQFSLASYLNCANQVFGAAIGTIPGTNRTIPGYQAALDIYQASLLTGANMADVAGTVAFESNFDLYPQNNYNSNGTTDMGPMQLNSANIGGGTFSVFPGSYGTNISPNQNFNGDPFENILSGAQYISHGLHGRAERYVGWGKPNTEVRRRAMARKAALNSLARYLTAFFGCLSLAAIPPSF